MSEDSAGTVYESLRNRWDRFPRRRRARPALCDSSTHASTLQRSQIAASPRPHRSLIVNVRWCRRCLHEITEDADPMAGAFATAAIVVLSAAYLDTSICLERRSPC